MPLKISVNNEQKKVIERTLADCDGNISESAKKLNISRKTLYRKIEKFQIDLLEHRQTN